VQQLPLIVLVEQLLGLLPRDRGDRQRAGEAVARGPGEEVADQVTALAAAFGYPSFDALLVDGAGGKVVFVDPGEEFKGDTDAAPDVAVGRGGVAADCRALARPA
jgi:hypothetical protein